MRKKLTDMLPDDIISKDVYHGNYHAFMAVPQTGLPAVCEEDKYE
ncbi:hypothetical protein [Anaerocolumna jejuensis]